MYEQQDFTLRQSGRPNGRRRRRRRRLRPAIQLGQVLPVIGFAIAIFALVLVARSKAPTRRRTSTCRSSSAAGPGALRA
jgi:hypothetical protein